MRLLGAFRGLLGTMTRSEEVDESIFDLGFDSDGSPIPRAGLKVLLQKYGENATFQMVARRVAYDVALLDWKLYRRKPGLAGPQGFPKEQIFEHPFLTLWKNPNPILVGFQFRYLCQLFLDIQGESLVLFQRDPESGAMEAMWPIPATWIQERPGPNRPFWRVSVNGWGPQPIPISEALWLHDPDPSDPYCKGLGVARSLDDEIAQDEWMNKYNGSFFRNGANPSQVALMEGVSAEEARKIRDNYKRQHSGFWNAFKVAFLGVPRGGKLSFEKTSPNHRDMDFVEGKKARRDAMLAAYNMQRFEVGINEDVNRASAQASADGKARNVTLPRVVYLEEAINTFLLPMWGDPTLVLCCENPVRETEEFRLAKASEGLSRGALTLDEWRIANGWDPLPNGAGAKTMPPLNVGSEKIATRASALEELRDVDPAAAAILERIWSHG